MFDWLLMHDTHEEAEHNMFPRPSEYAKLGAWIGLMFLGWLFTRGVCALGIPSDCGRGRWDSVEVFSDIQVLLHRCKFSLVLPTLADGTPTSSV